jgi:two-component system chemotaxis response regulator CheB
MPQPIAAPAVVESAVHDGRAGVVAIGISTGGPKALQQILPQLPADLPVGVLVVQHMPAGFTGPFAERLDRLCGISVREAADGELIRSGVVYLAPAGWHMTVHRATPVTVNLQLSRKPENSLHMPSVDVMMSSVAEVYRSAAMGIIMTGMGSDGLIGMKAIAEAGGITVGQDEATCTVYGMPRSCAEAGILKRIVSLEQIPREIMHAVRYRGAKETASPPRLAAAAHRST